MGQKRDCARNAKSLGATFVGCVAAACLIVGAAMLPSGAFSGGHSAYAAPEVTQQAAESSTTVAVDDGNFDTLQKALQDAKSGVHTVIALTGKYEAPQGFTHIDLPQGADIEISVPDDHTAMVSRADGNESTSGALLALTANTSTKLTISGDLTYRNSTTLAYVGNSNQLIINGGTYSGNTNANGGVIYADNGTVAINGGTFSGNKATNGSGGAIYLNGGSLSVKNATFFGNSTAISNETWSVGGGAIYAFDANVTLEDGAVFSGNVAHAKSRLGGGGALWVKGNLSIDGATFTDNASDPDGGWHCGGGAIFLSGLAKNGSSKGQTKTR